MGISKSCCKLFLFIFNTVFLIAGVCMFGVGIWTVVDKVYVSDIIGNEIFTAAAYMIIISGIIVIGVCILGFISLSQEKRILIIVYFVIWIVIFIFLIIGAILAVVFKGELESEMRNSMKDTLIQKYGGDSTEERTATNAWDRVQRELRCCSVDDESWDLYRSTRWFRSQDPRSSLITYVPATCCVVDVRTDTYVAQKQCQTWQLGPPRNPSYTLKNTALYYEGCYEAARNFVLDASSAIVAVGFTFGLTLIVGLVFTLFFLRHVTTLDDEEVKRRQRSKTPNDGL
ncbi:hypothetical protein LOTGIDRAFT_174048 [Lottia gigantea]|uniref:Tetraspanin n=1 Tax=Lottia gigantea TaxID=225164 RepID=V4AYF8_LOTGI|nr:hypothetical protein LOTGIDRAFT_174048 [Lottia gigantea]ESO98681.1 hypothetical protein LOTGIDRAFT_174048 [Lottia gigantea]